MTSRGVTSSVQSNVFFLNKNHRRPSINRRRILSAVMAFMGVYGLGMGVHANSAQTKVDTSPAIRRRFIDVTSMESPKVAYYTPMPRLWFLTGLVKEKSISDNYNYFLIAGITQLHNIFNYDMVKMCLSQIRRKSHIPRKYEKPLLIWYLFNKYGWLSMFSRQK